MAVKETSKQRYHLLYICEYAFCIPIFLGMLFAFCLVTSCKHDSSPEDKKSKAVFIIVDGISADVIEKLDPPVLNEIAQAGGYTRAYMGGNKGSYNETPTISAVGYNSLLTGTWANKHNVWDNDIEDPNYYYPTIFLIAEQFNPQLKTAIFSTWTDNRTKLIGEGLPQTGNIKLDYKFDGLELDTIKYPHDNNSAYIHMIDEAVAAEAARFIQEDAPDLSWVYLQYTDDMGHRFGDSEKFYEAVHTADKQVGKIWDAIKVREQKFDEDWLIVVTTDHGRDSVSGKHHGGQSDRERLTWIVTNADSLNERFGQTPAVVDIMPSIANHLGIAIPEQVKKEIDGVPFIGSVNLADLHAKKTDGKILLQWKSLDNTEATAEVFIAETNHFTTGGEDRYRKVGEVPIGEGTYTIDAVNDGTFYKILMKGPDHPVNAWVVE